MAPDLRHPISLRGIDDWLRKTADSLTAHAGQPTEIRDIAQSLRFKANAISRDPEYAAHPEPGGSV
jgi:hypothetical protein